MTIAALANRCALVHSRPMAANNQIRLLVVEDVPQVAQYIRGLLNSQAQIKLLDVMTDGSKVKGQIQQLRPDVVIIDALLQGRVRGLAVAQQLREDRRAIPVIILTVPQNPVQVDPSKGVDAVLSMPFSGYDLINRVERGPHARSQASDEGGASRIVQRLRPEGRRRQDDDRVQPGGGHRPARQADRAHRRQPPVRRPAGAAQGAGRRAVDPRPADGPDRRSRTSRTSSGGTPRASTSCSRRRGSRWPRWSPPATSTRCSRSCAGCTRSIVIDTPPVLNDVNLAFLDQSDLIVEIVTYDSTTIHNTIAVADAFRTIGYPATKVRYLVNRADSAGGIQPDDLARALGRVPEYSRRVRRAARRRVEQRGRAVRPRRAVGGDQPGHRPAGGVARRRIGAPAAARR